MFKNKRNRPGASLIAGTAKKPKNIDERDRPGPSSGILTPRNNIAYPDDDDDNIFGSQNSIPSSQPPSQRRYASYVSQRSNMVNISQMIAGHFAGNTDNSRALHTYYGYVLQKCGTKFDQPDNYVIECDHIQFVSKIRNTIQGSLEYPANIPKFISGFKSAMANEGILSKTLSVCMVSLPHSNGFPQSQESLMKNLLSIDFLQRDLLTVLLDRMQDLAKKASGCEMSSCILVMILAQLKFINKVKHGDVIFNKIIAVVESSPMDVKRIIVRHLGDVIESRRHSEIIRKLMEIFTEDDDILNESTLDAFGNMCLTTALLGELKQKIFDYLDRGAPTSLYPKFMKLLLKYNDDSSLGDLIYNIRSHLKWSTQGIRKELTDSKKSVLSLIKISLMRSTKMSDLWVKSIKISCTPDEHFPLDFIILVTMMEANDDRSATIETLIRKKFSDELFTRRLLRDVVAQFPEFVVDNLGIFLDIADHLFRSKEKIWEIGKVAFKFAFGIDACNRKVILSKLVGLVCEKTDAEVKTRALVMLSEIRVKYFAELQNNGIQLLLIQENIGDIGLTQYRILMDILCSIAYPMAPNTAPEELVHEIDMLVKKQLANGNIAVIRLGIIGAVKTIGHLVWHATEEESMGDLNQTILSANDFPAGPIREAAELYELVIKVASGNCADSLAMCYDELALAFSNRTSVGTNKKFPNRMFLNWLSDTSVEIFLEFFTIDSIPQYHEIDFIQKYTLTNGEENESTSINIGALTIRPPEKLESSILVLSPLFNLLRVLQFRLHKGNLANIYGICGFGIILPQHVGSLDDINLFDEFDVVTSKSVLDMYFHTANWFRQIISTFSCQQEPTLRKQVLTRLTELIRIEGQIRRLLTLAPTTYIAPNSTFIATQEKAHVFKKPAPMRSAPSTSKKGAQKKSVDNAESQGTLTADSRTQDTTVNLSKNREKAPKYCMSYGPRESYRQIDLDILMLLENPFITEYTLTEDRVGTTIGLQEYKFIIEDIVLKLESFVGLRKAVQLQIITSPEALVHDLVAMLPQIQQHFSTIVSDMTTSMEAAEEILESHHLYTANVNSLKLCFAITLRLYATLFSWVGFAEHTDLLQKGLQVIGESAETDIGNLASAAIQNIGKHVKLALEIGSALQMVYLVTTLTKITDKESDKVALENLYETFLSRHWYTCTGLIEKGTEFNIFLTELLKGVFRFADFNQLNAQIVWIRREIPLLKSRDDTLKTYPGFTRTNFTLIYKALCTSLVEVLNNKLNDKLSHSGNLKMWEAVIGVLDSLRDIVREISGPGNNLIYLKNANMILKTFLQNGIPLLEQCLMKRREQCMKIIRNLQDTTRFLNTLCCHSKLVNHTAAASQIPLVRETLEKLVFHVKRVLTINKCSSAFWVGILRNRNMQGDIIPRERDLEDSASDRTEDALPEDDDMSEMMEEENVSDGDDSRSRLL